MEEIKILISQDRYNQLLQAEKDVANIKNGKILALRIPPHINSCFSTRAFDSWGECRYYGEIKYSLTQKGLNREIKSILKKYEEEVGELRHNLFATERRYTELLDKYVRVHESITSDKSVSIEQMTCRQFRKWRKEIREKEK